MWKGKFRGGGIFRALGPQFIFSVGPVAGVSYSGSNYRRILVPYFGGGSSVPGRDAIHHALSSTRGLLAPMDEYSPVPLAMRLLLDLLAIYERPVFEPLRRLFRAGCCLKSRLVINAPSMGRPVNHHNTNSTPLLILSSCSPMFYVPPCVPSFVEIGAHQSSPNDALAGTHATLFFNKKRQYINYIMNCVLA